MILGLYDLDFWHGHMHFPNLELMKIYNYHIKNNDKVLFIKPGDELGRFNKIIYFKEIPSTIVPRSVDLSNNKSLHIGYGFYKQFFPIEEKYWNIAPNYLIYAPFSTKIPKNIYKTLIDGSIVRVENNDFSGFKDNTSAILVSDCDFLNLSNAKDFVKEYQRYHLYFRQLFHPKNMETLISFLPYENVLRNIFVIDFPVNYDLFKDYHTQYTDYSLGKPYLEETYEHFLNRLIRIILTYKNENIPLPYTRNKTNNNLITDIIKWGMNKERISFLDFAKKNNLPSNTTVNSQSNKIRILLKANPTTIKTESIDLKTYM